MALEKFFIIEIGNDEAVNTMVGEAITLVSSAPNNR
jgi:hypothetical protein